MEFVFSDKLKDVIEIFPNVLKDDRGFFLESFNEKEFEKIGLKLDFVQDNHSFSHKGVMRGLHMQRPPYDQGKLVRVMKGKALDVVLDLRKKSPSFGHWQSFILDSEVNNMVFVPSGFAHGFIALEDTYLGYKCTNFYHKESEGGVIWNDEKLNIDWGTINPIVSAKDIILPTFEEYISNPKLNVF